MKNKSLKDAIINSMTFSYSNLSSFDTCAYGWKTNYIDAEDGEQNFFAEFGTLVHNLMESFWKDELSANELKDEYCRLYGQVVKSEPPSYPAGMWESYYASGLDFFTNFPLNREDYEPIIIEGKINDIHDGVKIVVKPDLLAKRKSDNKIVLMDYKTSKPLRYDKLDMSKIEPYKKQLTLYAHFIEKHHNIKIDEICLLFVRIGREYTFEITDEYRKKTLKWLTDTVDKIKSEEDFEANTSNKYFCNNLCSFRSICPYKE